MANMKSEEELAELEKLSADYVPEQKVRSPPSSETGRLGQPKQGDLVGKRISSSLLTEEYARADIAYASKTKVFRCNPERHTAILTHERTFRLPIQNIVPSKATAIAAFEVTCHRKVTPLQCIR